MTKETAEKACALLYQIQNAERVLNFIASQEEAWFGPRNCTGIGIMPTDAISGARRSYQKVIEIAEWDLANL